MSSRRQGIYWLCTLPWTDQEIDAYEDRGALEPPFSLQDALTWAKGQGECSDSGYYHWQFMVGFSRKVSIRYLQESISSSGHYELSRSRAAEDYVGKEDTRIDGTSFELGRRPFKSNSKEDWDRIWELAREGKFLDIPSQIRVINILF